MKGRMKGKVGMGREREGLDGKEERKKTDERTTTCSDISSQNNIGITTSARDTIFHVCLFLGVILHSEAGKTVI